jgi:bifunctional non-homologous end joining protein LigD
MGLAAYRAKRSFDRTPEPAPKRARSKTGHSFVVQKHAARRLHYDFRLELDGVLLSWAVPKGPSTDPKEHRLAVRTEDHPLEYASFEGIIPKGEYGGGTVLLWDRGTWEPLEDARAGLKKGRLSFALHGEKLRGRWTLVRTRPRDDKEAWLLIKRSGDEDQRWNEESVASGRTMEEIATAPDRVWHSKKGAPDPAEVPGAKKKPLPSSVEPQLATLVEEPPEGDAWIHELKYDGYRILARVERGEARLFTRNQLDWTERVPSIARALAALPLQSAWIDGELVVLDASGRSDFGALQRALRPKAEHAVRYVAFDLLYLDGYDLRSAALEDRKALLEKLVPHEGRVRYGDHVSGNGDSFYAHMCELGVEGMVSKRRDRPYLAKRTRDWVKIKCLGREELVVGGYTDPSGSRVAIGALLVGQRENGELRYAGKVGTGFSRELLRSLKKELAAKEIERPPFANAPRGRGIHWVRPEMVVEVAFSERTRDGMLRQPRLLGVREDKPAREVRRERAVRLTSPNKVLWPELGITKEELASYYERVADRMLPHLAERPLTLVRCPDGLGHPCFFQRHPFAGMPEDVVRIDVAMKEEVETHTIVRDVRGLVSLAQIGALEIHTWGSHHRTLERPDQIVVDLDPAPDVAWPTTVDAAHEVRALLSELGLESWVKTTGGKGLHLVVPIARRTDWDETKEFVHAFARELASRHPDRYTASISKSKRGGKLFIDYLRNGRAATAVCAYSTRRHENATVSMPIAWSELTERLRPSDFTLRTVPDRIGRRDPWHGFFEARQSITQAAKRALGLSAPSSGRARRRKAV